MLQPGGILPRERTSPIRIGGERRRRRRGSAVEVGRESALVAPEPRVGAVRRSARRDGTELHDEEGLLQERRGGESGLCVFFGGVPPASPGGVPDGRWGRAAEDEEAAVLFRRESRGSLHPLHDGLHPCEGGAAQSEQPAGRRRRRRRQRRAPPRPDGPPRRRDRERLDRPVSSVRRRPCRVRPRPHRTFPTIAPGRIGGAVPQGPRRRKVPERRVLPTAGRHYQGEPRRFERDRRVQVRREQIFAAGTAWIVPPRAQIDRGVPGGGQPPPRRTLGCWRLQGPSPECDPRLRERGCGAEVPGLHRSAVPRPRPSGRVGGGERGIENTRL
mmetsp:Transcript_14607/g.42819  ORF Transcript_14607/g.42819 Transcript_14607/m.42819 type:complete len:329 (+) Transcript_14607:371-1357(+)